MTVLFFGGILAFFSFPIYRDVQDARSLARADLVRRQMIKEAPTAEALPPIQAVSIDQALINEDFGGRFAQKPSMIPRWGSPAKAGIAPATPPSVLYIMRYGRNENRWGGWYDEEVAIEQYPDTAWTRYRTKYPADTSVTRDDVAIVTKFGNRVYTALNPVFLLFWWPSGTRTVSVSLSRANVNEYFVKRYLEKYPSSL